MKIGNMMILVLMLCLSFAGFATDEVVVDVGDAGWLPVIGTIIGYIMNTYGGAVGVMLMVILFRILKKFGLENSELMDKVAKKAVARACDWVEVWAAKQADKPTSQEKYQKAVEKAFEIAGKLGVLTYVQKHIDELIEQYLKEFGDLTLLKKN